MKIVNGNSFPEMPDENYKMARVCWPTFMLHDAVANDNFGKLFELFPEYQFAFLNEQDDSLIAIGNSIPLFWDRPLEELPDDGWDWVLLEGIKQHQEGIKPNIMSAIQIMVPPGLKSKGISYKAVEHMTTIGRSIGLTSLIAPVRPNMKPLYPLIDINDYIKWRRDDGLLFDAWLRVHEKLGAKIIRPCVKAMDIRGTVEEWTEWTGQTFPGSGEYIIEGALTPIKIDLEKDIGIYIEPNVWMVHKI